MGIDTATTPTNTPPGRGKMRCNSCKSAVPTKEGDWFIPAGNTKNQVFLCRPCEAEHKDTHKRATVWK